MPSSGAQFGRRQLRRIGSQAPIGPVWPSRCDATGSNIRCVSVLKKAVRPPGACSNPREDHPGTTIQQRDIDEPSPRGIDGMRIIRDDINTRVQASPPNSSTTDPD
jgi:hypothetical protein